MMTSAQFVEASVNVTTNSPSQDYTHPDDHNLPTYVGSTVGSSSLFYSFIAFSFYLSKISVNADGLSSTVPVTSLAINARRGPTQV